MKSLKKTAAVLAALTFAMTAFTACGGSDNAPVESVPATEAATEAPTEAPTEEATTEAPTEEETVDEVTAQQAAELIQAVANTVWVGMDTDYTCYVLAFGEDEIYFAADDDSEVQGYWDIALDASHIYIYSDEELSDEIGGFDWEYDEESDTMIINGNVVMAQTEASTLEDAVSELEKMSVAKTVAEALNGTYWMGVDSDDSTAVLSMDGDVMVWAIMDAEGQTTANAYYWSMDYDAITLYDAAYEPVIAMEWNAAEDLSTLSLTIDGETVEMAQTDEATAEETVGTMLAITEVAAADDADYDDLDDGDLADEDLDDADADDADYDEGTDEDDADADTDADAAA